MKEGNWLPEQEDPTLCEDAMTTILNVLRARPPLVKPGIVALSTAGFSKYGRDIPFIFKPLHWILHTAHMDKQKMENLAIEAVAEKFAPIGSYYIMRPSILLSGAAKGVEKIRWEVEDGKVAWGGVGYFINRADVGAFLFEKIVKPFESGQEERTGKIFYITN